MEHFDFSTAVQLLIIVLASYFGARSGANIK